MSAALRLFAIESRRTFALWLVPVIVAASWLIFGNSLQYDIALWVETSVNMQTSLIFTGPLIAGAAAWIAGREKRQAMGELLATTPRSTIARDLASWSATAFAGVVAYGLIFLYVGLMTMAKATWGGPSWSPIGVGLLAVVAHAATGYAFGRYIPSRFTAPVIATLLFLGQVYIGRFAGGNGENQTLLTRIDSMFGELRYLSPVAPLEHGIWFRISPDVALGQTTWLAGISFVALALVALRDRVSLTTVVVSIAALTLAVGGGAATAIGSPSQNAPLNWDPQRTQAFSTPLAFEPVCADGTIPICVHPAYRAWLDELSTRTNRVLAPIAGLAGLPARAEQVDPFSWMESPDVLAIHLDTYLPNVDSTVDNIVRCALTDCYAEDGSVQYVELPCSGPSGDPATQEVIQRWLWMQAGNSWPMLELIESGYSGMSGARYDDLTPYVDRFAALSLEEQRAWLEANFAALRAGELPLNDLP